MRHPGKTSIETISLLGGLCFFLSAIEYMIPKPLPFIRLGFANLPLLLALDIMPFSSFMLLVSIKIIGQAMISGSLFSYVFLFSLGGTAASALLMYGLRKVSSRERISLIGISTAGALTFNIVQLFLAYYYVFGNGIRYAAAPIIALGIITGTLLGLAAEYFIGQSVWYTNLFGVSLRSSKSQEDGPEESRTENKNLQNGLQSANTSRLKKIFDSTDLAIAGLLMIPALLLNPDTGGRVIQFLFFWALAFLSGKKNNPLFTAALIAGIVFFNLIVPFGEVLFVAGPLKITSGALDAGIKRAVTLEGIMMLSRFSVRADLALPGSFGKILGESFKIFSSLGEEKKLFTRQNWARRLDKILMANGETVTALPHTAIKKSRAKAAKYKSRLLLAVIVILSWLPLIFSLIFPRL